MCPDLDVDAGWGGLGEEDAGRSLSPEQARELLLDPAGRAPGHETDGRRAR